MLFFFGNQKMRRHTAAGSVIDFTYCSSRGPAISPTTNLLKLYFVLHYIIPIFSRILSQYILNRYVADLPQYSLNGSILIGWKICGVLLCIISEMQFINGICIGGGSYWAGRAAARPLFCSCGPPMCLARPLLGT